MKFPQIFDTDKQGQVTGQPRDMTRPEKFRHLVEERIIFPVMAPFVLIGALGRGEPDLEGGPQ